MILESVVDDLEDLVFLDLEAAAFGGSWEEGVAVLACDVLVWALFVVAGGEVGVGTQVFVALVGDH